MKLNSTHLKRYKEIAGLFWKYGRSDLVKKMGVEPEGEEAAEPKEEKPVDSQNFKRTTVTQKETIKIGTNGKSDDKTEPTEKKGKSAATPEGLVNDLEAMGPTYVKLGQVLSSRPDLVPEGYRTALARLQDNVKPFPYEEVEKIVEQELGARISKAFAEFEREPIAAASLGQVHRAKLRDGRPVVVKIQRPDIRPVIEKDFEVLSELATTVD